MSYDVSFNYFTNDDLQEFMNSSEAECFFVDNILNWGAAEDLLDDILATTNLSCEIVVRKSCDRAFNRVVNSFGDVQRLYEELYVEYLKYFDDLYPTEDDKTWLKARCSDSFLSYRKYTWEDFLEEEFFSSPEYEHLWFGFGGDGGDIDYYVSLRITK